jgi:hypothetical protein
MTLLAPVKKILAWRLFSRRADVANFFAILKWWELRRIPYNAIVGVTGILTLAVLVIVASIAEEKFGEPLGLPDPTDYRSFCRFRLRHRCQYFLHAWLDCRDGCAGNLE